MGTHWCWNSWLRKYEVVGVHCRGLKNFAMSEVCHFVPVETLTMDAELFTQLNALELWSLKTVQPAVSVVKQLVSPCRSVQNLLFRNCDAMSDQLLNELWTVSWSRTSFFVLYSFVHCYSRLFSLWRCIRYRSASRDALLHTAITSRWINTKLAPLYKINCRDSYGEIRQTGW